MMDEGGVTAPVTVELGFGPGPSLKRGCPQALLLQPVLAAWLFWRCGRRFAALLCLVPAAVAGVLWLRYGKYWPMVALFWCDRAVLTDAGVRLQSGDHDTDRFGWDELEAIRYGRGPLVCLVLRERTLQPLCARPFRLIAALRDYGEPPKLQGIPGLPPRTCDALDGLHGLEVHGLPRHPLLAWVSPFEQPGKSFVPGLIGVALALLGWRWEAVVLGTMLFPLLLAPLQIWLLPEASLSLDWRVEHGQLRLSGRRRSITVPATDVVRVSELTERQLRSASSALLRPGEASWWRVQLVDRSYTLAVRGGSSQRLREALRAAAWVKDEEALSTEGWAELVMRGRG